MFKKAFTLAEVLITLGVIGVVAAMTLPTLIHNYQKQVWVNQLIKSHATIQQAFTKMMADDGVDNLFDTTAFQNQGEEYCTDFNNKCIDKYKKYFKEVSLKTYKSPNCLKTKYLNGKLYGSRCVQTLTLQDGTMIIQNLIWNVDPEGITDGIMRGFAGEITIDLNGEKNPNIFGRDVFKFVIGNNGIVYPYPSEAFNEWFKKAYGGPVCPDLWETADDPSCTCENDGSSTGEGCSARIFAERKMNY